jgi:hypothetical protein
MVHAGLVERRVDELGLIILTDNGWALARSESLAESMSEPGKAMAPREVTTPSIAFSDASRESALRRDHHCLILLLMAYREASTSRQRCQ